MSEAQIQTSILKYLKKKYPTALIFKHADKTRCGVPDIQFIYYGNTVWLEVKKPGGKVSDIQEWTLERLRNNNHKAYVVYSLQEVKEIL